MRINKEKNKADAAQNNHNRMSFMDFSQHPQLALQLAAADREIVNSLRQRMEQLENENQQLKREVKHLARGLALQGHSTSQQLQSMQNRIAKNEREQGRALLEQRNREINITDYIGINNNGASYDAELESTPSTERYQKLLRLKEKFTSLWKSEVPALKAELHNVKMQLNALTGSYLNQEGLKASKNLASDASNQPSTSQGNHIGKSVNHKKGNYSLSESLQTEEKTLLIPVDHSQISIPSLEGSSVGFNGPARQSGYSEALPASSIKSSVTNASFYTAMDKNLPAQSRQSAKSLLAGSSHYSSSTLGSSREKIKQFPVVPESTYLIYQLPNSPISMIPNISVNIQWLQKYRIPYQVIQNPQQMISPELSSKSIHSQSSSQPFFYDNERSKVGHQSTRESRRHGQMFVPHNQHQYNETIEQQYEYSSARSYAFSA